MLIFAVAVLVVEDVAGGVRLVAAHSQRQADVAEILGHEIVEGFGLVQIRVEALGQFLGLGADFRRGRAAVFLQAGVPAANLLPTGERGQLNVGAFVVGTFFFFFLSLSLSLSVVFALQVGTGPVIDAAAVVLGDLRIHARLVFQFQRAVGGNVDVELLRRGSMLFLSKS